jgi:hypothetical protein
VHDVNVIDHLVPIPGAYYVMDRGYLDFDPSPEVTAIAGYSGSGQLAAVKIQLGKAKMLFSGAIELTPQFINLFSRWAGCWVASSAGDGVYIRGLTR